MFYGEYGLLSHVIVLLQREGRVSYRGLKVQFHLDDDTLEAIKEELVYAKGLAVDEAGRVLIWTGGEPLAMPAVGSTPRHHIVPTAVAPATPLSPPALHATGLPHDGHTVVSEPPPAAPEAERRQL